MLTPSKPTNVDKNFPEIVASQIERSALRQDVSQVSSGSAGQSREMRVKTSERLDLPRVRAIENPGPQRSWDLGMPLRKKVQGVGAGIHYRVFETSADAGGE